MIPEKFSGAVMDTTEDPDKVSIENSSNNNILKDTQEKQDINDNNTVKSTPIENPEDSKQDELQTCTTNGTVANTNTEKTKESCQSPNQVEDHGELDKVEDFDEDGRYFSEDEDKLVINEGVNDRRSEGSVDTKAEDLVLDLKTGKPLNEAIKRPAEEEPELISKKPRPLEDLVSLDSLKTIPQIEFSIAQTKKDIQALEILVKQKEEEWNSLIRLLKRKEEMQLRLMRKKDIMHLEAGGDPAVAMEDNDKNDTSSNLLFLPQGGYTELGNSQIPLFMMNQFLSSNFPSVYSDVSGKPENLGKADPCAASGDNVSVIDIHTSTGKGGVEIPRISMSIEAQNKLGKHLTSTLNSNRNILPKPLGGSGIGTVNPPLSGFGPQGPLISVQHLIAAHRRDNPNMPPIRGAKRGAWRHKYDGEKRSSSREPERPSSVSSSSSDADLRLGAGTPLSASSAKGVTAVPLSVNSSYNINDPSVSYKDVLLQFAQLTQTQTEKQPGSPQISIIPVVSNDNSNSKKSESNRELTPSSRELTPTSAANALNTVASHEKSSALAKLLLESGGASIKGVPNDQGTNAQYLTLSALLSGGITTTIKDKPNITPAHGENRKKTAEDAGNPKCQGCNKHRAAFVCAGCGNQWYCSKDCQVTAWESHSEHCNS